MFRLTNPARRGYHVALASALLVALFALLIVGTTHTSSASAANAKQVRTAGNALPTPLDQLTNHTFTLSITHNGNTLAGPLQITQKALEYPALNGLFTAPATDFQKFFAWDDATLKYYLRFASNGQLTSQLFVFGSTNTDLKTPNAVRIVIGSPQLGSLSGGAGILTIEGKLQPDGNISGTSDQLIWKALPLERFNDLVNSKFTLTLFRNGNTLKGTLNIGTLTLLDPTGAALHSSFSAPATDFQKFFGWDDNTLKYYLQFASDGQLTSPVYVSSSNNTLTPYAVSILIGAPDPISLAGNRPGIITLNGNIRADGQIVATSGDTAWTATPLK